MIYTNLSVCYEIQVCPGVFFPRISHEKQLATTKSVKFITQVQVQYQ